MSLPAFDETWEWDGTTWSLAPSEPAPFPRRFPAFAFDEGRAEAVIFGGSGVSGETWVRSSKTLAPAVRMTIAWADAGVSGAVPVSLDVLVAAGGEASPAAGDPTGGFRVLAWDARPGGVWTEIASGPGTPAAPSEAAVDLDEDGVDRHLVGPDRTLRVAVVPHAVAGASRATVVADGLRVRIGWRKP